MSEHALARILVIRVMYLEACEPSKLAYIGELDFCLIDIQYTLCAQMYNMVENTISIDETSWVLTPLAFESTHSACLAP